MKKYLLGALCALLLTACGTAPAVDAGPAPTDASTPVGGALTVGAACQVLKWAQPCPGIECPWNELDPLTCDPMRVYDCALVLSVELDCAALPSPLCPVDICD